MMYLEDGITEIAFTPKGIITALFHPEVPKHFTKRGRGNSGTEKQSNFPEIIQENSDTATEYHKSPRA